MPGSATTQGRLGTCDDVPDRVAFRQTDGVGPLEKSSFAARWLAYVLPCQRFAHGLAAARA